MTVDSLRRDSRFALRSLSKSPGFVVVAVGTLGLGLGLVTATFAVLDSLRHPYLPIEDADRVFEVRAYGDRGTAGDQYQAVEAAVGRFVEGVAYYGFRRSVVAAGDSVDDALVFPVTGNLFPLLGAKPARGRLFRSEPGFEESDAALVSHQFWERTLAGRPLDGATLLVDGKVHRVVGVMPPAMTYPGFRGPTVWIPMPPGEREVRAQPVFRLRPETSQQDVERALELAAARLNAQLGAGPRPAGFRWRFVVGDPLELQAIHLAMAGAALIVLLLACANLAHLMLARGTARRREVALRFAIGARRRSLIAQLLSEGALLAVAGGLLGLVLSSWAIHLLAYKLSPSYGWLVIGTPHLSWRTLAFGFLAAGGTLLLFALLPAVRATDVNLTEPLKSDGGTTTGRVRRFSWIVVSEVALSLALLMSGTLLARTILRMAAFDFGYDVRGLYGASIGVHARHAPLDSASRIMHTALERVRHVPGVKSASLAHGASIDGYMIVSDAYNGEAGFLSPPVSSAVDPDYFRTLGVPVVPGRDFLAGDEAAGAVILDRRAAQLLFGGTGDDAVGRTVKLGDPESRAPWINVVGIVGPMEGEGGPFMRSPPRAYVTSHRQVARRATMVVRVERANPATSLGLRREIRETLPVGALTWVGPWGESFEVMFRSRRFVANVFALFAALSLALTAVGVYGVLAYMVSRRMREFAVRVALGADARLLVKTVIHDGAVMLLAGTGIGAFAAMAAGKLLNAWLYNVFYTDAVSLVIAELILIGAGLTACLGPARRAMRANPVETLRAS